MEFELASPAKNTGTRIARIRDRIINAPQEVCIERARYFTRSMSKNWDKDPLTRMSIGFAETLNNISVIIRDDELIVGCRTSKLKGAPLFPENKIRWIEGDVDNFDKREVQRALISEEEKQEINRDIVPFWTGKSVEDYFEARLSKDIMDDMDKYIFTFMLEITYGIGHFTMNQSQVLKSGLAEIIKTAQDSYNTLDEIEKTSEKGLFYLSVVRSLNAAISFAQRYSSLAEDLAEKEQNPARKEELQEIARVCGRVPEHPAATFQEAVQSFYFIHLIAQIESGGNSISLGRLDQILYPYYKKDLERGLITPEKARELVTLLFLKTNEIWNVLEEAYIPGGEGTEGKTTQNVTVGGVGTDGEDATNELSHIILDAYGEVRTVQPNFGVRFSDKSSSDLFSKAAEYAKDGVLLHFFNDDSIVKSLTAAGHTLSDARDYGVVGCLEPNAQGKSFGSTFAVQFNGIKCLELAMSNGIDNIFGYQSGVETGDPANFKTFDDLWNAYDKQMIHFSNQMMKGIHCLDSTIADFVPSPFASAMIEGPMEKGMDLTRGGAIYNSTGVQLMGFSNIADSLYAVKKTVFEQNRFSMSDLSEWLSDDWTDNEDKRKYLCHKVDKYGNDKKEVDAMAKKVADHFCDLLDSNRNFRGGTYWPGIFSVGFHITMGAFTGATPDGRNAGDAFGNGVTPSNGVTLKGPTAIMNSVSKLPLTRITNGANLNMRFQGTKIKTENLVSLVKTYFARGGLQVQFNMVNSETLRTAQASPEDYRDLIVRISGYSGIFVNLSDIAQDEIISRTEFELANA
ncbi:formate C-acetyltransferase/glycerol dehydratase family glycyl radical enzyme [bacterium]|nr:formate C-acetyltransferase/glycerol dehydratase family glycyl radical enzyme [bacterium]